MKMRYRVPVYIGEAEDGTPKHREVPAMFVTTLFAVTPHLDTIDEDGAALSWTRPRRKEFGRWTVTHRPTGKAVAHWLALWSARRLAVRLQALTTLDWEHVEDWCSTPAAEPVRVLLGVARYCPGSARGRRELLTTLLTDCRDASDKMGALHKLTVFEDFIEFEGEG